MRVHLAPSVDLLSISYLNIPRIPDPRSVPKGISSGPKIERGEKVDNGIFDYSEFSSAVDDDVHHSDGGDLSRHVSVPLLPLPSGPIVAEAVKIINGREAVNSQNGNTNNIGNKSPSSPRKFSINKNIDKSNSSDENDEKNMKKYDKEGYEKDKFVVFKLRNSSRQIAVVSTSERTARNALIQRIRRSRDRSSDPSNSNIQHGSHSNEDNINSPNKNDLKKINTETTRNVNHHFQEFIDPECTKNIIIPAGMLNKHGEKKKKSTKNVESSVQDPSGLFWAMYDPFRSSYDSATKNTTSSTTSTPSPQRTDSIGDVEVDGSGLEDFNGSIRSGEVLGLFSRNFSSPTQTVSPSRDNAPLLSDAKLDPGSPLKCSVLLHLGGVLIFENSYTANTKNNFKCQSWVDYDLILKIKFADMIKQLLPISSEISTDISVTRKYEITLVIRLVEENNVERNNNQKENDVLINGKTKFIISNNMNNNDQVNRQAFVRNEKLQITFPSPGTFLLQVCYRHLESVTDEKYFSVCTIYLQVQ